MSQNEGSVCGKQRIIWFNSLTVKGFGPLATKFVQTSPLHCHARLHLVFCQTWSCTLWPNITTLYSYCTKTYSFISLFRCHFTNIRCAVTFLERRGFLPNKPNLFSLFLTVLSWTLAFNMLTEACRVWTLGLYFYSFSEHCTVHPWWEMFTPGKTGACLKCFLL